MQLTANAAKVFKPNVNPNLWSQSTLAIARVIIGIMMVHNGLDKLADIESFAHAYVEYLGLPFPIFLSYIAAYTELIGAPLVAVGLFTRPAALGLVGTMTVAIYHHISVAGLSLPYLELSAIYWVCFLYFAINGAGLFSVDALIANFLDHTSLSLKARQVMGLEKSFQAMNAEKDLEVSR